MVHISKALGEIGPQAGVVVNPALFVPDMAAVLAKCESPIERDLAVALFGYIGLRRRTLNWESRLRGTVDFAVEAQYEVSTGVGDFRIDLLVAIQANGVRSSLAVECDGHDFHERTKAQAAHDKSRDRALAAAGCTVLRFTGSEIWRDATACADEVQRVLAERTGISF